MLKNETTKGKDVRIELLIMYLLCTTTNMQDSIVAQSAAKKRIVSLV